METQYSQWSKILLKTLNWASSSNSQIDVSCRNGHWAKLQILQRFQPENIGWYIHLFTFWTGSNWPQSLRSHYKVVWLFGLRISSEWGAPFSRWFSLFLCLKFSSLEGQSFMFPWPDSSCPLCRAEKVKPLLICLCFTLVVPPHFWRLMAVEHVNQRKSL